MASRGDLVCRWSWTAGTLCRKGVPKEAGQTELPIELQEAIAAELVKVPQRRLAAASAELSDRYRSGRSESASPFLQSPEDVAAYAAFRLPATYAAAASALAETRDRVPQWSPATLLDVGAGPGTVMWAAAETWPGLSSVTLLEREDRMIALGRRLAVQSPAAVVRDAIWVKADATGPLDIPPRDLVTCAYVLGELGEHDLAELVGRLWQATAGVLVLIEPGTMAGFGRIRRVREQVLALGGMTVAPCPHDACCPIGEKDWCHFSQRVARSRVYRQVKAGELGYEDEKFSYVALSRMAPDPIADRVLRHPWIGKGHVRLELCTPQGLRSTVITRKDKALYKEARDLGWGSAILPQTRP